MNHLAEQDGPEPVHMSNGKTRNSRRKGQTLFSSITEYFGQVNSYLREKGRWRALLAVMITWFLLDMAYYGLGLDNPRTISTIWLSGVPPNPYQPDAGCNNATWQADPAQPNITIYEMLKQDSIRNMITGSSGTLSGSIIILLAINYVPRVTWMAWMFVVLAGLFAINGGTFFVTYETDKHALTIILYVLAQTIFNLGPNTMTFILPAELFGTRYRATFYGLAAAAGKLGAIMIQPIVSYCVFGGSSQSWDHRNFSWMLLAFCPAMLLGAFVTWVWIPEVQYPRGQGAQAVAEVDENASDDGLDDVQSKPTFRQQLKLPNRPLGDIQQNPDEGQVIGVRRNLARLFRRSPRGSATGRVGEPLMRDIELSNPHGSGVIRQRHPELDESDLGNGTGLRQTYG
jgi:PHS family inorganic phosphate transporter-like MFS transporter